MQQNSFSYPAMLDLKNKKCVIIGGGKVAVRKALPLIEAGADLTVIAPAADPQLLTLAKTGLLQLELRAYADNDLIDAFVTIAATDDFHINRKIAAAAPCLCNVVTEPSLGNFSVPSTVKNGALTFTLSTGGMPALTRVLSKRTAFWRQTLNQSVIGLLHAGKLDQAKEIITDAANRFRLESQNSPR